MFVYTQYFIFRYAVLNSFIFLDFFFSRFFRIFAFSFRLLIHRYWYDCDCSFATTFDARCVHGEIHFSMVANEMLHLYYIFFRFFFFTRRMKFSCRIPILMTGCVCTRCAVVFFSVWIVDLCDWIECILLNSKTMQFTLIPSVPSHPPQNKRATATATGLNFMWFMHLCVYICVCSKRNEKFQSYIWKFLYTKEKKWKEAPETMKTPDN